MATYRIAENIPLPPNNALPRKPPGPLAQALMTLKPGQSLLVKADDPTDLRSSIATAKRHTEGTFATRTVEGGTRIWRAE